MLIIDNVDDNDDGHCSFSYIECSTITSIKVDAGSLLNVVSFEIMDMPGIQSIEIDKNALVKCGSFKVVNIRDLKTILVDENTLVSCAYCEIRGTFMNDWSLEGDLLPLNYFYHYALIC